MNMALLKVLNKAHNDHSTMGKYWNMSMVKICKESS